MSKKPHQPPDDPSSAPESGTVRNNTSGNQPSQPDKRPAAPRSKPGERQPAERDDPSVAGEER